MAMWEQQVLASLEPIQAALGWEIESGSQSNQLSWNDSRCRRGVLDMQIGHDIFEIICRILRPTDAHQE